MQIFELLTHRRLQTLQGHNGTVTAICGLGDEMVVSGSFDKTIKIWSIQNGSCLQTLSGHNASVSTLAVLADGTLLSGSFDNTIKVWKAA